MELATTVRERIFVPCQLENLGVFCDLPYTSQDQLIWKTSLEERIFQAAVMGHPLVQNGLKLFGITPTQIPALNELDRIFFRETGWRLLESENALTELDHYRLAAKKIRPICSRIRTDLENTLAWPDLIHDLFHCFLFLDKDYEDFYLRISALFVDTLKLGNEPLVNEVRRVSWHFVEYGIIGEPGNFKYFGPILNENREGARLRERQDLIRLISVEELSKVKLPWQDDPKYLVGQTMRRYYATPSFKILREQFTAWEKTIRETRIGAR